MPFDDDGDGGYPAGDRVERPDRHLNERKNYYPRRYAYPLGDRNVTTVVRSRGRVTSVTIPERDHWFPGWTYWRNRFDRRTNPGDVNPTFAPQVLREQTVSAADGALPIVYGEHVIGGKILDVRTYAGDLYVVFGLASGTIDSVVTYTFARSTPKVGHVFELVPPETASALIGPVYTANYGYNPTRPGRTVGVMKFVSGLTGFSGIPEVRFTIRGRVVSDTRTNVHPYSQNYALGTGLTLDSGTSPTITTVANLWGENKAARIDCTGGAATLSFTTLTTTVSAGVAGAKRVQASFWARSVSGSTTLSAKIDRGAGLSETSFSATLTTAWKRYVFEHGSTWGGTSQPVCRLVLANAQVIEIANKSLQKNGGVVAATQIDKGFVVTNGAEIDTRTQWSDNPVLCVKDYLTETYDLGRPDFMNAEWGNAAYLCEVQRNGDNRFRLNAAFLQPASSKQIFKTMLLACNGRLYWSERHNPTQLPQIGIWIDVENQYVDLALDEDTNAMDSSLWQVERQDAPNRVVVRYANADDSYKTDTAVSESDDVADGAEIRDATYDVASITTPRHAAQLAEYLRKRDTDGRLRATVQTTPAGVLTAPGALVTLSTASGASAKQMLVTQTERQPWGGHVLQLREYDSAVYGTATYDTSKDPDIPGEGDLMAYLDAWFGCYGSQFPYAGPSPVSATISGNEDWTDAVGYRRYNKLTINAGVIITIKRFPFYLFCNELSFGDAAAAIKANGEAGSASIATGGSSFGTWQARGGKIDSGASEACGGAAGGILIVCANIVSEAAGLLQAHGGAGYSSGSTAGASLADGGEGAFPGSPFPAAAAENFLGGHLLAQYLATGGADSGGVNQGLGGGSGYSGAGGSGIGAGGGYNSGAVPTPRIPPGPQALLELARMGCLGGGGGGAEVVNAVACRAGGGGGGGVALFAKTLSFTPTMTATGGAAASGATGGAGVAFIVQL